MSKILLEDNDVKVHLNYNDETLPKSATTKVVIELNYINSGNPFRNYNNEFDYQDEVRLKIMKIFNDISNPLDEIEL